MTTADELIRAAGLRVTAPRLAVLDALRRAAAPAAAHPHPDVEHITAAARSELGSVSQQTIYDVLAAFERADLVRRIDPAGSAGARYEIQSHDNHHHMVCRSCRRIVDVPCAGDDVPCMHPAASEDFDIEIAEVVYWGRCAECRIEDAGLDDAKPEDRVEPADGEESIAR